jgi:YD repeat-containing protein
VKKIGQQAFNGCSNLLEVYIDKGVEKLGAMLFYMSSVDKIYFNGTSDEFKEIDSGKNYNAWYYVGADWGDKAFYVYCTDVMLIYNFKDGKDTPKTEEYGITPETKTYYIPVKAELSSPKGLCSIKVDIGTNNLPKKETKTRFGELYGTCEYTYDSNGKLIKIVQKDDNGEVFSCIEHKYNSSGKIIESSLIDSTVAVNIKVEYTYDNQNNLCKEVQTDQSGQKNVIIYEYNAVGLLVKTIYKYGNEELAVTYEYDANGNLIKEVDGSFTFTYTYDASGRMVKAVCPDMDANNYGKNITYAIMYDKNGNISKIVSTNASGEKETCSFEYKEVTVPLDYCMDMVTIEYMFSQLNMMDNVITIVPGDLIFPNS